MSEELRQSAEQGLRFSRRRQRQGKEMISSLWSNRTRKVPQKLTEEFLNEEKQRTDASGSEGTKNTYRFGFLCLLYF